MIKSYLGKNNRHLQQYIRLTTHTLEENTSVAQITLVTKHQPQNEQHVIVCKSNEVFNPIYD